MNSCFYENKVTFLERLYKDENLLKKSDMGEKLVKDWDKNSKCLAGIKSLLYF
jgi:hypothetical protein